MAKEIAELNAKILAITMEIREKYPELSKYLAEMPETIPNVPNPEINVPTLKEYYDSLQVMMKRYGAQHIG